MDKFQFTWHFPFNDADDQSPDCVYGASNALDLLLNIETVAKSLVGSDGLTCSLVIDDDRKFPERLPREMFSTINGLMEEEARQERIMEFDLEIGSLISVDAEIGRHTWHEIAEMGRIRLIELCQSGDIDFECKALFDRRKNEYIDFDTKIHLRKDEQ